MGTKDGEGGDVLGSAEGGSDSPVLGAIDGRESAAAAGVGVGAGVEEEDGDHREPGVGGVVEGSSPLAVGVENPVGVGDEGASDGGDRSFAGGAVEDALAARVRRRFGDGGAAVGWRDESAVHGGDDGAGGGVACGDCSAGFAGGRERPAGHDDEGNPGGFGAKLGKGGRAETVESGKGMDGLVVRARRKGGGGR